MVDEQYLLGIRLDRARDSLSVLRAEKQNTENQQIERPLH